MKEEQRPLHEQRSVGKKKLGPLVLAEIFGYLLELGEEKGYEPNSWKDRLRNHSEFMESQARHFIEMEKAKDKDYWYTEKKRDGTDCQTPANHAYANFWNAACIALDVYYSHPAPAKALGAGQWVMTDDKECPITFYPRVTQGNK